MSNPVGKAVKVVCVANDRFVLPVYVMIYSLIQNLNPDRELVLYLFDSQISTPNKEKIRSLEQTRPGIQIHFVDPMLSRIESLPRINHLGAETYVRLNIDIALPADLERLVYLDSDLRVNRDIAPLFDSDLQGAIVGAVPDQYLENLGLGLSYLEELPAAEKALPYFNAGVLVVDLPRWRASQVSERVLDFTVEHAGVLRNGDQDGLNRVLQGKWQPLDAMNNVQINSLGYEKRRDAGYTEAFLQKADEILQTFRSRPHILHFSGSFKPWRGFGVNRDYVREYLRDVGRSRFYSSPGYASFYLAALGKFVIYHLQKIFTSANRGAFKR